MPNSPCWRALRQAEDLDSLIGLYSPKGPDWSNMGRSLIRAMLNSARGLSDKDRLAAGAGGARGSTASRTWTGSRFVARIDIGTDTNGDDKNEVRGAVTRDHRDYAQLMGQLTAPATYAPQPAYTPMACADADGTVCRHRGAAAVPAAGHDRAGRAGHACPAWAR
jgi:hypothetical protein